jgi:hypothetical protein
MARHRACQRWADLLNSRVAGHLRPVLGEELWKAFVLHANNQYKSSFISVFAAKTLSCVGKRNGSPCPKSFCVDLTSPTAFDLLERLHLDHEQDVRITCDMWCKALPTEPEDWDDGIKGGLLCHLLFGVKDSTAFGPRCIRFRCGPPRKWEWGVYCHELRLPHYTNLRDVAL